MAPLRIASSCRSTRGETSRASSGTRAAPADAACWSRSARLARPTAFRTRTCWIFSSRRSRPSSIDSVGASLAARRADLVDANELHEFVAARLIRRDDALGAEGLHHAVVAVVGGAAVVDFCKKPLQT